MKVVLQHVHSALLTVPTTKDWIEAIVLLVIGRLSWSGFYSLADW